MARILVIGASRGIGLATVKRALEADHEVRAFSRAASRIELTSPRLEKIDGDALIEAAVEKALQSEDAVIQVLGTGPSLSKVDTFSKATRILVDAMTASGPRRLLCVTGFGAGETRGRGGILYDYVFMPLVLRRIYDDKDVQERIIRDSKSRLDHRPPRIPEQRALHRPRRCHRRAVEVAPRANLAGRRRGLPRRRHRRRLDLPQGPRARCQRLSLPLSRRPL